MLWVAVPGVEAPLSLPSYGGRRAVIRRSFDELIAMEHAHTAARVPFLHVSF